MTISNWHYAPDRYLVGRHDEALTVRSAERQVSVIAISRDGDIQNPEPVENQSGVEECLRVHATLRGTAAIPDDLRIVPERAVSTDALDALGLIDSASASVAVDIALWRQPCDETLDEIAWRRVFTWVIGGNPDAEHVSILTPPAPKLASIVGAYSYAVGNQTPRYGILSVTATEDGWRIVDCWGLIDDAARIDELAERFAEGDLSR